MDGDDAAFEALFERHLDAVFEAAWNVTRERWMAADVTLETFAAAWQDLDLLPADDVAEALVDEAWRRAHGRRPEAGYDTGTRIRVAGDGGADGRDASADDGAGVGSPNLGPVLRARIVSALQSRGVPLTPERPVHFASTSGSGGGGRRWLLRLGAAAVLVVAGVLAVLAVDGDDSDELAIDDFVAEDTYDDQRDDRADDHRDLDADGDDTTPTTSGDDTSSTTAEPTTTVEATTTTEPESEEPPPSDPAPTTTTTTAPPPSTTTTAPPPRPVINSFDGWWDDWCGNGRIVVELTWDSRHATSATLRPRGGETFSVPVDGNFSACAPRDLEWVLTVTNSAGTDSEEIVVG
jgi:hypothetical protein